MSRKDFYERIRNKHKHRPSDAEKKEIIRKRELRRANELKGGTPPTKKKTKNQDPETVKLRQQDLTRRKVLCQAMRGQQEYSMISARAYAKRVAKKQRRKDGLETGRAYVQYRYTRDSVIRRRGIVQKNPAK
jgi:hypothetical protein